MARRGLTDGEWARLEPLLPRRRRKGRPPKSHRLMLDALLWLGRTGAPWRDLPEGFGPWRTVTTRFYRWTRAVVCGSNDADGASELEVQLTGIKALTVGDFYL